MDKPTSLFSCCATYLLWSSHYLLQHRLVIGQRLTDLAPPLSKLTLLQLQPRRKLQLLYYSPLFPVSFLFYFISVSLLFPSSLEGTVGEDGCVSWTVTVSSWTSTGIISTPKKGNISGTNCVTWTSKARRKGGCGQSRAGLPIFNISTESCAQPDGGHSTLGTTAGGWTPSLIVYLI